jgi:predicted PurR-regulated permease PerM
VATLALIAGLLLMVLPSIVVALVIALFLAIVFSPLVDRIARRGAPRPAGAALATLIVVAVAAVATWLVVAGVISQQQEISRNLQAAVTNLQDILSSAGMSATAATSAEDSVRTSAPVFLTGLIPALGNLFGAVANGVICIFVALFTCFFLLKDGHSIAERAGRWMPVRGRYAASSSTRRPPRSAVISWA